MDEDLKELYENVILDHNRNPRNNNKMLDAMCSGVGCNPSCGDDITVFVKTNNNIVSDISFDGEGCAISQASASMMTEILLHKTIEEALEIANEVCLCLSSGSNEESLEKYGDLCVLNGVKKFPMRIKCATLAWHAFKDAISKLN